MTLYIILFWRLYHQASWHSKHSTLHIDHMHAVHGYVTYGRQMVKK